MRLNFLLEELLETAHAAGHVWQLDQREDGTYFFRFCPDQKMNVDPPALLDGLVDLLVVALGTATLMGLTRPTLTDHHPDPDAAVTLSVVRDWIHDAFAGYPVDSDGTVKNDQLREAVLAHVEDCHRLEQCYRRKTPLDEAWDRVLAANFKKVPGVTKRGHGVDLKKPADWRAPDLTDLMTDFFKPLNVEASRESQT
jgi:hypothetical protein